MEANDIADELRTCFERLSKLAPKQADFIQFAQSALDVELTKGARKTHIKRMLNEFHTYARNVLSKDGYKKFKYGEVEADGSVDDNALLVAINRGKIISRDEYARVMDELNLLLQEKEEISSENEAKIFMINQILARYDLETKLAVEK